MGCNSRDIEGNGLLQLVPEDRKKLHTVSLFLSHPQAPKEIRGGETRRPHLSHPFQPVMKYKLAVDQKSGGWED